MTEKQEKVQEETVNEEPKFVGVKEAPKYDYNQHIGKKVQVADCEIQKGEFGHFILVSTVPLDKFTNNEKEEVEIRATRILGLATDEDGNVYVPKDYKADIFLRSMGIENGDFLSLIGKEVIVQKLVKKDKEFLTLEKA